MGEKRPQSGAKRPVSVRNVLVAKRPGDETSWYRAGGLDKGTQVDQPDAPVGPKGGTGGRWVGR